MSEQGVSCLRMYSPYIERRSRCPSLRRTHTASIAAVQSTPSVFFFLISPGPVAGEERSERYWPISVLGGF